MWHGALAMLSGIVLKPDLKGISVLEQYSGICLQFWEFRTLSLSLKHIQSLPQCKQHDFAFQKFSAFARFNAPPIVTRR